MKLVKMYDGYAIERGLFYHEYLDISKPNGFYDDTMRVKSYCIAKTSEEAIEAHKKFLEIKELENLNKRKVLKWFL